MSSHIMKMFLNQKIVFLFNKFFISFVKDVKESSETIKTSIRKHYKVIDKSSTEHITEFWDAWKDNIVAVIKDSSIDSVLQVKVLKEHSMKDIVAAFPEEEKETLWNHIYILLIFAYLHNEVSSESVQEDESKEEEEDDEEGEEGETEEAEKDEADELEKLLNKVSENNEKTAQVETLFNKVVEIIAMIQKGNDIKDEMDDILDDDVKSMLSKITAKKSKNAPEPESLGDKVGADDFDMGNIFGNVAQNSKIANLAKEISEEIDISKIKLEKPEDIMKMMDFSDGNNLMGDIIKKVSSKISNKIQAGELKQDDLLGEAMTMMNMMGKGGMGPLGNLFGNNPMMSEVMKAMKKGKPMQTKQDVFNRASTRDRLREKLEKRKQSQNKD